MLCFPDLTAHVELEEVMVHFAKQEVVVLDFLTQSLVQSSLVGTVVVMHENRHEDSLKSLVGAAFEAVVTDHRRNRDESAERVILLLEMIAVA